MAAKVAHSDGRTVARYSNADKAWAWGWRLKRLSQEIMILEDYAHHDKPEDYGTQELREEAQRCFDAVKKLCQAFNARDRSMGLRVTQQRAS